MLVRTLTLVVVLCLAGMPAVARAQMVNPFAGQMGPMAPGNMAPYGSVAGAMPHIMQSVNGIMMGMGNSLSGMARSVAGVFGMEGEGSMVPVGAELSQQHGPPGDEPALEIEAPEADVGENLVELVIGACAGGAVIGAFAVATATPAVGAAAAPAAVVAAPAAVTAFAAAMGVGCGLGVVTAAASVTAVVGYRGITQ